MAAAVGRRAAVLFGDSITQRAWAEDGTPGWAALLADAYSRKVDVFNRGFSGFNTRQGAAIAGEVFPPPPPGARGLLFATVFFGANDAAAATGHPAEPAKPLQHVPLPEFEANLTAIVAAARRAVDAAGAVLVLTPPPVDAARWPDRSTPAAAAYSAAAARVVAAAAAAAPGGGGGARVLLVDAHALVAGAPDGPARLLNDGLHLSGAGNALVADAVAAALAGAGLAPPDLPLDFPLWRDAAGDAAAVAAALAPAALDAVRARPAPVAR